MKKSHVNCNLRAPFWLRIRTTKMSSHLSASAAGCALAFFIVIVFAAFPIERLTGKIEVAIDQTPALSQKDNEIDSALKQLIEIRKLKASNEDLEQPIVEKVEQLAMLNPASLSSNDLIPNETTSSDENLIAALNKKPVFNGSAIASFPFVYPVMGPRKSSGYGLRVHPIRGFSTKHKGIDLAAPVGASIRAMAKGKVIFADPYAGYGKLVVLDHGNGITTHYAHCDRLVVHTGEEIEMGQVIAEVGSTGMSTGPHLHLEARINGQPINPEKYFVGLADKAEG